jgi:hypothetical protein
LANKEWNILKSQIATSNSPKDKAFGDPDCKKSLGNIGLISEHSEYFETFCRKSRKSRLISDFICNFAGWIIK